MTEVAAFYFPGFHQDPRNDAWHGDGWTEWELLKAARPRFTSHRQPVVPAWGYFDESNHAWAEREIDLAADHGITTFLFDWYWYDGPFLERALKNGFLKAQNRQRMKFALMWANHDWLNIHPAPATMPYQSLLDGRVDRQRWDQLTAHVLENFMHEDNYLRIDGKPFFTIYEPATFIAGFGGIDEARAAMEAFAESARAHGHDGIHFNAVVWTEPIVPTKRKLENAGEALCSLGFESVTSYVWLHHINVFDAPFPGLPYGDAASTAYAAWEQCRAEFPLPFLPNVTVGWDSSPRTVQTDSFERRLYPWTSVIVDNTGEAIEEAIHQAMIFANANGSPMITINAWNEWTEGSYLLPDESEGTTRIRAVKRGLEREL